MSGYPGSGKVETYVLQGVDALRRLLNLAADDLGDQLVGELSQAASGSLALDDLDHLAADGADLGGGGVGGLLDLVRPAAGESNGEEADEVVVGSLDSDVGLNEGLPFADKGAQLVGSEVEAVEVGQAVLALNLVHPKLNLAESVVLVLLEVGEGDLQNPTLQSIVGVLETGGAVHKSLADTGHGVSQDVLSLLFISVRKRGLVVRV